MAGRSGRSSKKNHFQSIFHSVPVAILEKDFSSIEKLKASLKKSGTTNYRTYLRQHRKILMDTFRSVRIIHANQAALLLYGVKSKAILAKVFAKTIDQQSFSAILNIVGGLMEGQPRLTLEFKAMGLDGRQFDAHMRLQVPPESAGSLKRVLVVVEDMSAQKKYERHLKRLAQTDGLTHVLNNGTVMERLQEEFLRARRYKNELSVMMVDMDHFKKINDQYGHLKGDIVLRDTAAIIKENLREVDVIGRYGGDEFIVLLPETSPKNATIAAERIRKLFEELAMDKAKKDIYSTISVGICGINSKGIESIKELIRTADRALYFAKTAGRNKIIIQ